MEKTLRSSLRQYGKKNANTEKKRKTPVSSKHHRWRFTVEPSPLRDSPGSSIPYYPSRSEEHAQLGSGYWLLTTPLFYKGYREAPRFNINLWCLLPPDAGVEGDWPSLWDPLERGDRFMILANAQKRVRTRLLDKLDVSSCIKLLIIIWSGDRVNQST